MTLMKRIEHFILMAAMLSLFLSDQGTAQNHLQMRGDMVPGAVGQSTKSRRQNVFGYSQPIELHVPAAARVAFLEKGKFIEPRLAKVKVGLRIGSVYRFKVTSISNFEGLELFPSLEVIDRLYPSREKFLDFPVPIRITHDDLVDALNGKLITKVVYVENPRQALPVAKINGEQRTLRVGAGEDPLTEAENLGRPIAILRLGSRTPDFEAISDFGAPQVMDYAKLEVPPTGDGSRKSPIGEPWPLDEYLFDGGDKNRKTIVGADFSLRGVDIEDTIVHFDTLDGQRNVAATNRVPIYSPRFAAIQKSYGLIITHQNEQFMGVGNQEGLVKRKRLDFVGTSMQQVQPRGALTTKTASIFRDRTRGVRAENIVSPRGVFSYLKLYEDFQIVAMGKMDNAEVLRLNIGLQAAQEWDHYTAIQVVVDNKTSNVAKRVQSAQELVRDKPIPGSSKVRIVKVCNKSDAKPGEMVEFTLRFDNVGTKTVGNVTIVDNLTTRLELVEGSSSCDLKHDFLTQANEKDSLLLRWEIDAPLPPGQGGIIRFQCKVR